LFHLQFILASPSRFPATFSRAGISGGKFMSAPGFLAKARQHLAVGASLVALIAKLGAPFPAAAQNKPITAN
jgi:hypothetical protein